MLANGCSDTDIAKLMETLFTRDLQPIPRQKAVPCHVSNSNLYLWLFFSFSVLFITQHNY